MRDAKRRAIIFISLAILLAVIAGILFMKQVREVDNQLGEKVTIYVAKHAITSREQLKKEDFTSREIPSKYLTEGTLGSLENIDQFVSIVPLSEGEPLNSNLLKPAKELTSGNARAVTLIRSDRIIFDGSMEANDLVDIIVSHEKSGGYDKTETHIFMKDVTIAGVSKGEEGLSAIGVEVSLGAAESLIHEINFAHSIRVLKASQGQSEEMNDEKQQEKAEEKDGEKEEAVDKEESENKEKDKEDKDEEDKSKKDKKEDKDKKDKKDK